MGLFSLGGDKKTTNTTYSTTNQFTDNSSNAAEGAVAVGAGANVNITDGGATRAALDANRDVAGMSLAANQNVSMAALDTTARVSGSALNLADRALAANRDVAGMALGANRDVNIESLRTTSSLAANAINTVAGIGEVASRERIDLLESTNLALQNSRGASDKIADLASAALERSQTPDSAVTKQLLWVIGAVAAIAVLTLFGRGRKTA